MEIFLIIFFILGGLLVSYNASVLIVDLPKPNHSGALMIVWFILCGVIVSAMYSRNEELEKRQMKCPEYEPIQNRVYILKE